MGVGKEMVSVIIIAEGLVAAFLAAAYVGLWATIDRGIAHVFEGCVLISSGFESCPTSSVLVANIVHSSRSAYDKPFEASAYILDEVPRVESVH